MKTEWDDRMSDPEYVKALEKAEVDVLREDLAELRAQLAASNSSADTFRDQRDELRAECERLKALVGSDPTTATRDDLRRWTAQQHDEIRDLRTTLAEREAQLAEAKADADHERKARFAEVAGLSAAVREREAEIERLRAEIADWKNGADAEAKAGDEARAALATLEQRKLDHIIEAVKGAATAARAEALEEEARLMQGGHKTVCPPAEIGFGCGNCVRAEAIRALASDTTKGET